MASCPCCSSPLVRQVRNRQAYWFCRHCWQVMPILQLPTSNPYDWISLVGAIQHNDEPLATSQG